MVKWFNVYGLVFVIVIMIPNIVFAIKNKDGFLNKWNNKLVEIIEQIGRFGCMCFMIFNVPKTYFGWFSKEAFIAYLVIDIFLIITYCVTWIVLWKKNNIFRALTLSIVPSVLFLFSGIIIRSILLVCFSLLFAPTHILISYKNAK